MIALVLRRMRIESEKSARVQRPKVGRIQLLRTGQTTLRYTPAIQFDVVAIALLWNPKAPTVFTRASSPFYGHRHSCFRVPVTRRAGLTMVASYSSDTRTTTPEEQVNTHSLSPALTAMPSNMPLKTKWWRGSTEYQ